jgi:hypothetical protein
MSKETSFEKMQDDFEERHSREIIPLRQSKTKINKSIEISNVMRDITTPNIEKPGMNPYMYQSMKKLQFLR